MASATQADNNYQFKLVLLGESGVGKSAIVRRLTSNQFLMNEKATVPVAFCTHVYKNNSGGTAKLEIWDTAGQERFHTMVSVYYRKARAAVVVFDITKPQTFTNAKKWIREVKEQVGIDNIVIMLAGNKNDLENIRLIDQTEAESYAKENKLLYLETSAKNGKNVQEMFAKIAEELLEQEKKGKGTGQGSVELVDLESEVPAKKCPPKCHCNNG